MCLHKSSAQPHMVTIEILIMEIIMAQLRIVTDEQKSDFNLPELLFFSLLKTSLGLL